MKFEKFNNFSGLNEMMWKFAAAFEKIDTICLDLDITRDEFVRLINQMDMEIRSIRCYVKHQRGHIGQIFRDDEKWRSQEFFQNH